MKVLVTGVTGQIGSAIAEALSARGDQVKGLVRDPQKLGVLSPGALEVTPGDVTNTESLRRAVDGVDVVVHAAGVVSYWHRRDGEQLRVNVEGTRNVLAAAREAGVRRLLLTSSIATLGWLPPGEIGDETTEFNWHGLGATYMETKREAEALVLAETGLETLAVNPGITLGAGDLRRNGGRILFQVYAGVPGVPPGFTTVASLQDVVEGHLAAVDRGRSGERYILGGHALSYVELFAKIAAVLGKPAPARVLPRRVLRGYARFQVAAASLRRREPQMTPLLVEISSRNRRYHSSKAMRELGYAPRPLETGIEACARWYRDQGLLRA